MSLKISQPVGAKLKLSGLKTTSNYIGDSVSELSRLTISLASTISNTVSA